MKWYLKVVRDNYANFSGRARREEYWMFQLFNILISFGLALTLGLLAMLIETPVIMVLIYVYFLGILIPSLAVTVRRLHDTEKSGWMILIGLIPLVGSIILLVFYCTEGTKGSNQYGDDPKATSNNEIDEIGVRTNF